MKKGISCIIPCLNSEKYIKKNIITINKIFQKYEKKFEIILIDDFSKDKTLEIIKSLRSNKVKIIKNKKNLGKSSSIIKGVKKSAFNKVIFVDSDLPYLKNFKQIIKGLKKYDLVFVDRGHKDSRKLNSNETFYQSLREIIGGSIKFLIKIIFSFPYKDTQAGLKGFKKTKDFSKIKFYSRNFFLDVELINFYHKKGKKIKNIPTSYSVPKTSTIKLFSFKNIEIILEFIKIVFLVKFKS